MFYTKRYIFNYDASKTPWINHVKLLMHDGMECTAFLLKDNDIHDLIDIKFDDGFEATAYESELEVVK